MFKCPVCHYWFVHPTDYDMHLPSCRYRANPKGGDDDGDRDPVDRDAVLASAR